MPRYKLHVKKMIKVLICMTHCVIIFAFVQRAILTFSNISYQFMVDTRNGLFGLSVAGRVMEELKIVIVPAATPNLQTEE